MLPAQSQDNSELHEEFSAFFPTTDNVVSLCSPLTPRTPCTPSCTTSEDVCQGTSRILSLIIHPFLHSDTSLTHLCRACLLLSTTTHLHQTAQGPSAEVIHPYSSFVVKREENWCAFRHRNSYPAKIWVCIKSWLESLNCHYERGRISQVFFSICFSSKHKRREKSTL